jgi:hypothetical protein
LGVGRLKIRPVGFAAELAETPKEANMDMRRLRTIALCFTVASAMLASQDVSPAAVVLGPSENDLFNGFWLRSKKALGGGTAEQLRARIGDDETQAIWDCAKSAACRASFGKKVGPGELKNVQSVLNALLGYGRE